MEVGSCFRDYDDFKESFVSFKKETKCQYGLRNSITVRNHNRKHGTCIREEITFTHVKFICVEPHSHNKKKKQLSNGCPAYLVLEYCEELDRLVIKEQNSSHVHLGGLKNFHKVKGITSVVRKIATRQCGSPPRKLSIRTLRQRPSVNRSLVKKCNGSSIHAGLGALQTRKRATSAFEESTTRYSSTFPQKQSKRRHLPLLDPLVNKELDCESTHLGLGDNQIDSSISSPIHETAPGPVDNHVIKEHLSNHAHIVQKESINGSISSPLWESASGPDKSPCQRLPRKRLGRNLCLEVTCNEPTVKFPVSDNWPASPVETNTVSLSSKENVSGLSLERITNGIQELLRIDRGSLASYSVDAMENLDRLSFQTSKMCALFTKFPESLLLHRVQSKSHHILYAFLVENKERVGKVVHFAVLKEETEESMSEVLNVFAQFNPEYLKVKVIFTDASFVHKATLKEMFPTAQVLLSVYHTVRLIEKKVREVLGLQDCMEIALRDVVFSPSTENRMKLSKMLKNVRDPQFHQFIETHWISCEMLWYMHVKKGLHSCSTYMDSLQLITHKITSIYSKQPSLENSILYLVEYADCFNSKGLENLNQGSSYSTEFIPRKVAPKKVGRKPKDTSKTTSLPCPDVLPPRSSTRISSLPSSSVLLPKLAQFLPKPAPSQSKPEPPVKPKPQTSLQPEPESPLQPEQDPHMLAEPEPTLIVKQKPLLTETDHILPETENLQPIRETLLLEPLFTNIDPILHESECLLHKLEPLGSKWNPLLPESDVMTKLSPRLLKSEPLLPKPEPPLPKLEPAVPKLEPPLPKLVPLPPKLDPLLPKLELPLPKLETPLPKLEPSLLKLEPSLHDWDPLLLKSDTLLSKLEPLLLKSELMPPEWEPLLPKEEPLLQEQECQHPELLHSPMPSLVQLQQSLSDDDCMLVALKETCTEVAYQLCLSEWEVVKKSSRVIKMYDASTSVKLIEDIHEVSRDCETCSCYFNKRYRLPCRHILTILQTQKRPVEDGMVCPRWQRRYQRPTLTEEDILGRVRCSAISQEVGEERFTKIKSLSKELANLLMQCDGPELKERCSTLQSIVAMWKKHQKPVENIEEDKVNYLGELPLLWRKQDYE